ncbi:unnamed protein product [Rangifer tarandus platyrhynchus]|uniref:Uncharacterized protein n=1 Tax=Rangifer tarandus platyrhynchus TaxID=3082113 RepID=A0ABN8ZNT6_RANTA|nr:unnamed protein product [Rangifer tarandus platyrhynchus]
MAAILGHAPPQLRPRARGCAYRKGILKRKQCEQRIEEETTEKRRVSGTPSSVHEEMGWLEGYQPSCCLREDDVYTRKAESQRSPRSPKEPWQQQTLLILLCDVMNCLHHFESVFVDILQQSCTLIPKEFHIGK